MGKEWSPQFLGAGPRGQVWPRCLEIKPSRDRKGPYLGVGSTGSALPPRQAHPGAKKPIIVDGVLSEQPSSRWAGKDPAPHPLPSPCCPALVQRTEAVCYEGRWSARSICSWPVLMPLCHRGLTAPNRRPCWSRSSVSWLTGDGDRDGVFWPEISGLKVWTAPSSCSTSSGKTWSQA